MLDRYCRRYDALLLLMASTLVSCGGIGTPFGSTPSSVVKQSYMYCNSGEYSKAEEFLSADLKKLIHGDIGVMGGGVKAACEKSSHGGTITSIEVKSETVRGEGATVIVDIHFKDNSVKRDDRTELIKENGSWKISH